LQLSFLVQADTITGNKSKTGDELGGGGGWRNREEETEAECSTCYVHKKCRQKFTWKAEQKTLRDVEQSILLISSLHYLVEWM